MKKLACAIWLLAGCSTPSFLNNLLHPPDMATDQWWKTSTPMLDARQETAAAALGDKLLVLGGIDAASTPLATVEIYDPSTKKWSPAAALPEPLYSANVAVVGARLFVVGALGAGDAAVGRGYVYDPAGDGWSPIAAMPAGSERGAAMAAAVDSIIYVAGGLRAGAAVDDFSAYDTVADSWTMLPSLPVARDHGGGATVGGLFYAIGGRVVDPAMPAQVVNVFDPAVASWSTNDFMPLPTPRSDFAVAVDGDSILIAGGEDGDGARGETERYTPMPSPSPSPFGGRWSLLAPMPTPRHGMGAALIGGLLYAPGGADASGVHPVVVMETLEP